MPGESFSILVYLINFSRICSQNMITGGFYFYLFYQVFPLVHQSIIHCGFFDVNKTNLFNLFIYLVAINKIKPMYHHSLWVVWCEVNRWEQKGRCKWGPRRSQVRCVHEGPQVNSVITHRHLRYHHSMWRLMAHELMVLPRSWLTLISFRQKRW